MFARKFKIAALAASLLTFGCAKTLSSNVKTSGIYAQFNLNGDSAGGATAEAILQVGGPTGTYIELTGGDEVTCNGIPLVGSEILGMVTYRIPVAYQVNGAYEFVFTRPDEEPMAATVTLPDPVLVAQPASGARITAGTELSVSWTPGARSTDPVTTTLSKREGGSCFSHTQLPDTGAERVPASYTAVDGTESEATLTVSREREGTHPARLDGRTRAYQRAKVTLTLAR